MSKLPLRCYIHVQDAVATPTTGEPPRRLQFLSQFYVADTFPRGPRPTHVYLVTPVKKFDLTVREQIGWVPVEQCLLFVGEGPAALRDPETYIARKAMLVTYLRDSAPGAAGNAADPGLAADLMRRETAFYDRPSETEAKELWRKGLFEIYYVYDETKTHLFLGNKQSVVFENTRRETLLGWVPKKRLCLWNTREAVEFNKQEIDKRTKPALVFNNNQDLTQFLNALRPPLLEELQRREPAVLSAWEDLQVRQAWPYDLPRYPVLDTLRSKDWSDNVAYEVGIIGHLYGGNQQQPLLTQAEIARIQAKVDELIAGVSNVQVVFLIDGTLSMDKWIKDVKEAVKQIFDKVRNLNAEEFHVRQMSCAIHFYRSDLEKEHMIETNAFGGEADAIKILNKDNLFGGGDRQQMFAAITKSLQRHPFQPEATKMLVVIGDAGNFHKAGGQTPEEVAKILIAGGSAAKAGTAGAKRYAFPVNFFAVAVGDSPEKFEEQTGKIANLLAEHDLQEALSRLPADNPQNASARAALVKALQAQRHRVLVSKNSESIVQSIVQRFQVAVREAKFYREMLRDLRDGVTPGAANVADKRGAEGDAYGLVWRQQAEELLTANNLQELKKAQQGVQRFEVGWVFEKHPEEIIPPRADREPFAIRHSAFMHRSEVLQLKQFLEGLRVRFSAGASDQQARDAWAEVLKKITGDDEVDGSLTPKELARKYLGINSRTGILSLSYDEIAHLTPEKKAELQYKLELCAKKLGDVALEQAAAYKQLPPAAGDFEPTTERKPLGETKVWWPRSDVLTPAQDPRGWIDRTLLP